MSGDFNWWCAVIQRRGNRTKDRTGIFFQEFQVEVRPAAATLCRRAVTETVLGFSDQFNQIRWRSPRAALFLGL
jgi:hypothetical protein